MLKRFFNFIPVTVILNHTQLTGHIRQLAQTIAANHTDLSGIILVGIQQGGVVVAEKLADELKTIAPDASVLLGKLDITFYRDDFRNAILAPDKMHLPFSIENKVLILVDDVLFTGRTIKAALDALLDYGRPAKVELCVLIDRKEHRQFPIQADYTGAAVTTNRTDKVKMHQDDTGELEVVLLDS